ncbi:MAG: hypothetical protein R3E84_20465 [Pseudomonadales bacterium]
MSSAHPDLGKLGVFWHTQARQVPLMLSSPRRWLIAPGNFTFVLMTDRNATDS